MRRILLVLGITAIALGAVVVVACGASDRPEPPESNVPIGEWFAQKVMATGTSMECYSIAPTGDVELRHNGLPVVTDRGKYGNGQITWNSGRAPGKVSGSGEAISISGTRFTKIQSCLNPR